MAPMDIYPTMLDLADLPLLPDQHADGVSIVPLLQAQSAKRGPIYFHYPHYSPQGGKPASSVREGDWKLVKHYETGQTELYNLKDDIGETNNLREQYPEIAAELEMKLDTRLNAINAPMPSKR